jgi:HSP20 family molecular chaperone IbpA
MLMLNPSSIIKELDNMFTTYTSTVNTPTLSTSTSLLKGTAVSEDEINYVLYYDLPGYDKNNITVEVDKSTRYLTVKADPDDSANHLRGKTPNDTSVVYIYNELGNRRKYTHKTKLTWDRIDLEHAPRVVYADGVLKVIFTKHMKTYSDDNVLRLAPE